MSIFPQSRRSKSQPAASAPLIEGVVPSLGAQPAEKNAPMQRWRSSPLASLVHALWRIFTLNRKATVGICIVLFFVLVALIGPLFIHTDPSAFSNDVLIPPSTAHWLGTTQTGQDIFSQLVVGTRVSILWGFATGRVVETVALMVGLISGYLGGIVDDVLTLLINVFLVLPGFPLAVVLAAYVPSKGPLTVALVITLTSWAYQARVLRAQPLSMRHPNFIHATPLPAPPTLPLIFF